MKKLITLLFTSMLAFSVLAAETVNINTASAAEIAEALQGVGMEPRRKSSPTGRKTARFRTSTNWSMSKGLALKHSTRIAIGLCSMVRALAPPTDQNGTLYSRPVGSGRVL